MSKKSIIRDPSDKSPFTKLEIHILKTIYESLNGEAWHDTDSINFDVLVKIKEIYGFTKIESMYIAALYVENYDHNGNFDLTDPPEIPKMHMYNITYHQDVNAFRDIHYDIIASSDAMAHWGSLYDFNNDVEKFSEDRWEDDIELGDYGEVYDWTIDEDPEGLGHLIANPQKNITNIRLENRNNIKKILKEHEESLFNSSKMNKNLDRIIDRLVDETHYNGIDFTYSWFNLPPPHVPPLNLSSRHYNSFLSHLKDLYGIRDEGEMQFIWRNYYRRLLMKYRQ